MREPMESVSPYAVINPDAGRDGVFAGDAWKVRKEGGVEDRYLHHFRAADFQSRLDPAHRGRIVQRCKLRKLPDLGQHGSIEACRTGESVCAVHDPMSD